MTAPKITSSEATQRGRILPAGVILAGGRATRLGGGDKALRVCGGRTLLDHVIASLSPQTSGLVLNANGDPTRFARWKLPVVPDPLPGQPGPLAGILAGMLWVSQNCEARDIITVPTDVPFVPRDLVQRLINAREAADMEIACAASSGRMHPVIGLFPVRLADDLSRAIQNGQHRVRDWVSAHGTALAHYDAEPDPFFNVNDDADLAEAARRLADPRGQ
jgi:molybdopterin-guanine dinucleotide biosynthesis protein A